MIHNHKEGLLENIQGMDSLGFKYLLGGKAKAEGGGASPLFPTMVVREKKLREEVGSTMIKIGTM